MKPAPGTQGRVADEEEEQEKHQASQIKRKSPSRPLMIIDGKDNYKGEEAQTQKGELLQVIGLSCTVEDQYSNEREDKSNSELIVLLKLVFSDL